MSRPRSSHDKLLAVLERMPAPMDAGDLAHALGWSESRVRQVARELESAGSVQRVPGAVGEGRGPRAFLYALPGALPPMPPDTPALDKHTVVVTPNNQEARVLGRVEGHFYEIQYLTGPEKFQTTTLHGNLLRPFQPGRERPDPVRTVDAVKEAA